MSDQEIVKTMKMNSQPNGQPARQPKSRRNRNQAQADTAPAAQSIADDQKSKAASLPVLCATAGNSSNSQNSETVTQVQARIDVGFGNALFIRGQGDGLSWDKGRQLTCLDAATWNWSTNQPQGQVVFKLLLNDQVWAQGEDLAVQVGQKLEVVPSF